MSADASHGYQLRRAGPADAPAIADLFLASRRASMPWLPVLHGREATVAFFRDVVPARAEVWLETTSGGELVGFIAFGGGEVDSPAWILRARTSPFANARRARAQGPPRRSEWRNSARAPHGRRKGAPTSFEAEVG